MKHFLLLNTKVLTYLIAALITIGGTGEMLAEGSKDLFTPTTSGYRQYLNVTNTRQIITLFQTMAYIKSMSMPAR
ncbi:MAG: hypothetical protein IPI42_16525 [Saprospiraceae bacterium]|nr:hypothetical protein [Candidatus Parvibacillus calidus]